MQNMPRVTRYSAGLHKTIISLVRLTHGPGPFFAPPRRTDLVIGQPDGLDPTVIRARITPHRSFSVQARPSVGITTRDVGKHAALHRAAATLPSAIRRGRGMPREEGAVSPSASGARSARPLAAIRKILAAHPALRASSFRIGSQSTSAGTRTFATQLMATPYGQMNGVPIRGPFTPPIDTQPSNQTEPGQSDRQRSSAPSSGGAVHRPVRSTAIGAAAAVHGYSPEAAPGHKAPNSSPEDGDTGGSRQSGMLFLDGQSLGRWIVRHLEDSFARPSLGISGIDPRAMPAWSGSPIFG